MIMDDFLIYVLQFSISIGALSLFYWLVLAKLTFYQLNRIYLATSVLISFLLPFIDPTAYWPGDSPNDSPILNSIPAIGNIAFRSSTPKSSVDSSTIVLFPLLAGSTILLIRLLAQYISLVRLRRNSILVHQERTMRIFDPGKAVAPFSFGTCVYIHRKMYSHDELQQITEHESVHVREHHTADILLSEILCILNWYNPFAWLLRKYIRRNLEFIADEAVLHKGSDLKKYQYLLLRSSTGSPFTLGNTFSMQNLKNRIIMMNTIKSSGAQLLKFIAILPILFLVSVLFRSNKAVAPDIRPAAIQAEGVAGLQNDIEGGKLLYIVDDWIQPSNFELKYINQKDIVSINMWKGAEAVEKFGTAAENGAMAITTKLPLYVIDGVVQMKTSNSEDLLKTDDIASIHVLKGESDKEKYGHRCENGIVEITTKKKK